jgi:hypothetical protein
MITEPELRFHGPIYHHYVVEHDSKVYKCSTLAYASYLAEKFESKIWNAVLQKFIAPHIGLCKYCDKYSKLHFVDGNRGSFPLENDTFGCKECDSVYHIKDILMETGAYKAI